MAGYAMVYCDILMGDDVENPERGHGNRNLIAFSEDGMHFTDAPENPVSCGRTDCSNNIVYNAQRDVFMMYRRATINASDVRRIAYSESEDLVSWTQPVTIVHREENDALHLYSMHVTPYHGVLSAVSRTYAPKRTNWATAKTTIRGRPLRAAAISGVQLDGEAAFTSAP